MQTLDNWLRSAAKRIPRLDAELILAEYTKHDRAYILTHGEESIEEEAEKLCNTALERRAAGEPLANIFQHKDFYGRTFYIEAGKVLIPRPESEEIIEIAKEIDQKTPIASILDVGTGSGCLAIALALELPKAKVRAVDISDEALNVASKNAEALRAKVSFLQSNLLEKVDSLPDLIVANLPYVDRNWDWLDQNTLDYEPSLALYADNHGLQLIFELIQQIKQKNSSNKTINILLEADPTQHKAIIDFAEQNDLMLIKQSGYILYLQSKGE